MSDKYVKLDDVIKMFCAIDCGCSSPCATNEECKDIKRFRSLASIDIETDKHHFCVFCSSHGDGDTLYEMSDWDGGIEFNYIRNIHYCPLCGRRLKKREIKF